MVISKRGPRAASDQSGALESGLDSAQLESEAAERALIERLRAGNEAGFGELVDCLHSRLLAMARTLVSSEAVAQEAVQDTWMAVIRGIDRFEGRSTLRTWVFAILVRRARSAGGREARERRHGRLAEDTSAGAVAVAPETDADEPGIGGRGRWETPPVPWGFEDGESAMLGHEMLAVLVDAFAKLPSAQRAVLLLRDVEGLSASEACNILELSETNQRVLLHRARTRVRRALARYLRPEDPSGA